MPVIQALLDLLGLVELVVFFALLFKRTRSSEQYTPLIVQEWRANNEPDDQGRFIRIRGRHGGLVSWVLAKFGLDDEISLAVLEGRVEFEEASLAGRQQTMIPLSSLSSVKYGYHKPWRGAVILGYCTIFIVVSLLVAVRAANEGPGVLAYGRSHLLAEQLFGQVAGLAVGALHFVLNRHLRVGFREHSNQFNGLQFKRSVIENKEISEVQAAYVCLLIQTLIENDRARQHA